MESSAMKDTNNSFDEFANEALNIVRERFERNAFQNLGGAERRQLGTNLCAWLRETLMTWYFEITTDVC